VKFMAISDSGAETKPRVLYACAGAADAGQIADLVARRLDDEEWGAISCLSGIGAGLSGFLEYAKEADNIIIDGCPVSCGRIMFEQHGLPFREIWITDQGVVKGSTPATPEVVERVANSIKARIDGK
jgi:uncharacterized metal-binding protein